MCSSKVQLLTWPDKLLNFKFCVLIWFLALILKHLCRYGHARRC